MCTLIVCRNAHPRYPLIVASNRDEYYKRESRGPWCFDVGLSRQTLSPIDMKRGGTWIGVCTRGWFVGLTNQDDDCHLNGAMSRGHVVMTLLSFSNIDDATDYVMHVDSTKHRPFNVVYGDTNGMKLASVHADGPRVSDVQDGITIVTNDHTPSAYYSKRESEATLAAQRALRSPDPIASLERALSTHVPHEETYQSLCVHDDAIGFGTVSSAIISVDTSLNVEYRHMEGHACRLNRNNELWRLRGS